MEYKYLIDGTHFNFKDKYKEPIKVENMDTEDVENFIDAIRKISKELNIEINPIYQEDYKYWTAGMNEDVDVYDLFERDGLFYE